MFQRFEGRVVLNPSVYTIQPSEVCGGVWVDAEQRFVPVAHTETLYNNDTHTTLYGYQDQQGDVRAYLLSVPPGRASPAYQITEAARPAGYYEHQRTVAGRGWFDQWVAPIVDEPTMRVTRPIPENPAYPLRVSPGEAFQVYARNMGVHVLAIFSGASFKDEYEVEVPPRGSYRL